MLLERLRSRVPPVTTRNGGGPCKGGKPASEGTGQAEACLTRPAINARENSRHKKSACSRLWRYRARTKRVTTPGHGIDRDEADCSAGEGRGQAVEWLLSAVGRTREAVRQWKAWLGWRTVR